MKKIGIITFWFADNFGALLQNRATQEILKKNGYKVITIKFMPISKSKKIIIKKIFEIIFNIEKLKKFLLRRKDKFINKKSNMIKEYQSNKFKLFRKNYIEYSSTIPELKKIDEISKCDYYICGSDQIWNPAALSSEKVSDFYFLNFCDNQKKIAYAPSIAAEEIPKNLHKYYKEQLLKFKNLSTREKRGAELIEELSGREAKVVLDPTLLLKGDEWRKIIKTPKKDKYIFAYFLGMTKEVELCMNKFAKVNNLEIILLKYDHEKSYPDFKEEDAIEVNEFLGYIDGAEYIFTDSFHGAVFSTVFHKKFFVFNRSLKYTKDMSSRITTILGNLDLMSRFILNPLNEKLETIDIDYIKVEEKLDILRADSIKYLIDSIENRS